MGEGVFHAFPDGLHVFLVQLVWSETEKKEDNDETRSKTKYLSRQGVSRSNQRNKRVACSMKHERAEVCKERTQYFRTYELHTRPAARTDRVARANQKEPTVVNSRFFRSESGSLGFHIAKRTSYRIDHLPVFVGVHEALELHLRLLPLDGHHAGVVEPLRGQAGSFEGAHMKKKL